MRPSTVDECFRLLDAGTADGVVIAELAGFSTALALGMRDRVRTVDEPVSLTPLHVVISKGHPQARTMLYYVNASIQQLRSRGDYDKIIEEHLLAFWGNQDAMESKKKEAPKDPSSPATPAPSEQNERGSVKASEPNRDGDTGKTP